MRLALKAQIKYWTLFLLTALMVGCAMKGTITGGEKDTDPPVILKSSPANYSTNYTGNTIVIEFDEIVRLENINEQLIISPPLKRNPAFRASDKKLTIQWSDTLKENTTYNFYFGNAIVDNNEGNELDSNVFVFSTGDSIDQGFIEGKVRNAFTHETIENAAILIYKTDDDSALYTQPPYYATNSNSSGDFRANSLKDTNYKVLAVFDENNSLTYEYATEYVGFVDERINANSKVDFWVFKEETDEQFRLDAKTISNFKWSATFKKPLVNPQLTYLFSEKTDWFIDQWSLDQDSLLIYLTDLPDTNRAYFEIKDETGFIDTFNFGVKEIVRYQTALNNQKRRSKKKQEEVELPSLTYSSIKISPELRNGVQRYFAPLDFVFDTPINWSNLDQALFIQNGDTMSFADPNFKGKWEASDSLNDMQPIENSSYNFKLSYPWKLKSKYAIYFPDSCLVDILGRKSDSTVINFSTLEYEDYGAMIFNLSYPDENRPPLILQFIDDDSKVILEYHLKGEDKIELPLFEPTKMRARIIFDSNENGVWDTGNLTEKKQPEKVEYFQEYIDIKANWDINLTWKIQTTL